MGGVLRAQGVSAFPTPAGAAHAESHAQERLAKWRGQVEFKADCFADPASFMFGLSKLKPSVVQLSCHGDREGIWISGGLVERGKIVQALVAYNKDRTKL